MIKTAIALTGLLASTTLATAATPQALLLANYAAQAKAADASFTGFSPARGKALFLAHVTTGKPDTPSCSTCHTTDPRQPGRTRAGKEIAPMAVSATPDRFADLDKAEKWFGRNCDSVLGRACTPLEKGDFMSFMVSQ